MRAIRLTVAASTLLIVMACSTSKQIQALKPEANYSPEVVYDRQLSYLQMPVELSVADIQNQANKYLNGLIYQDDNLGDDNLMLRVWKQSAFQIDEQGGKLKIRLPLKVWTRIRYGTDTFGLSAYDTRDLNLNGVVKINATVSFSNWKLTTVTQVEGIDWVESPTVSVMGKNMPITYLINPALSVFKSRIGKMVDESIEKSLDIKPYVFSAVESISQPLEVNTEYHTWFALQPLEVYATKALLANKKIALNLGLKAFIETTVGSKPTLSYDKNKLSLKSVDKMPAEFNANIAAVIRYEHAAVLMQKNFAGQKFESGKRSVTVTSINLWGKDGKLIVEAGMKGSLNGLFYLAGLPKYDAVKNEVYLDDVDFVLDSKNKLLKAGDWLVHGLIVKKIQQNCRFSIKDYLQDGEKTMAGYLTNYQPVKGVTLNGKLNQLAPNKMFLTPAAMVAMVAAKGSVSVNIAGLQ